MESDRHRMLTEIFARAIGLGAEERRPYLDVACSGDADLRKDLDSLLAFDAQEDDFLSASVARRHVRAVLHEHAGSVGRPSYPDRIGPYRILDLLGEGAQGLVFKAEQPTLRRTVALKVLRAGFFATREDLKRFSREIRALTLLRHPTIATIFDGGETAAGHHYFAMEFVEGVPIDVYVRRHAPSVRDRLRLFCKICDGIDYAHREGVIHRDLKPTNILVDSVGHPKILDFGLARITGRALSLASSLASTGSGSGGLVGSFHYMSPEQARGRREETGAQSDLYSLGVLLYEILTGRRPYDLGASLPEAVITICETLPPLPSTFNHDLSGDLDRIVATALEKEPSRRYGSVNSLVEDIRLHLRGEPIGIRRSNLAYVLRKRFGKHRIGLGLAATALAIAGIGLGIWAWSLPRSTARARVRAVELQRRIERGPAEPLLGEARALFEKHPKLPEAGLVLAQAQIRAGLSHRIRHLRHGIESGRQPWPFRLLLSHVYRESDPELARRLEREAVLDFPDSADAWHLRSFTTFRLDEAIRTVDEALERDPDHLLALTRLAHLCERVADYGRAHAAALRLQEIHGNDNAGLYWAKFQAVLLMKQGLFREAEERLDALVASNPGSRRKALVLRGHARLGAGDFERAVEDYTELIHSGTPRTPWFRRWRATPLWILGRLEQASQDYERFRHTQGFVSYADARLFLVRHERARRLEASGRGAEAARLVELAGLELEAARRRAQDGSWLGRILDCLAGSLAPEELIREADHSDLEQRCEAYYYAAEMSLLAGRIEQARRWFRECVATELRFDLNEAADPMSEYYLARARVDQMDEG